MSFYSTGPLPEPHADCPGVEGPCLGCGRTICQTCEPTGRSDELCDRCWWIEDPGTPGLDGVA